MIRAVSRALLSALILFSSFFWASRAVEASSPVYTITDLGTFAGWTSSQANSINDAGEIVGACGVNSGAEPFLYVNGVMADLGSLGNHNYTIANHINSMGQIVGFGMVSGGGPWGVQFTPTGPKAIGSLGGASSTAPWINDTGQIVGGSDTPHNGEHVYLASQGNIVDLGGFCPENTFGAAINNLGISWKTAACQLPITAHRRSTTTALSRSSQVWEATTRPVKPSMIPIRSSGGRIPLRIASRHFFTAMV